MPICVFELYGQTSSAPTESRLQKTAISEPNAGLRVIRRMATKPILPEVQAERAQATEDYRRAHQDAIDRIATLRAARLKQQARQAKPPGTKAETKTRAAARP